MTTTEAWFILTVTVIVFVAFLWLRDPLYRFGQRLGGRIWLR